MFWTLCVLGALTIAAPNVATRPDLLGSWQLDEKESEEASRKLRPLRPGEKPGKFPDEPEESASGTEEPRPERREREMGSPELEAPVGLGEFLKPPHTLSISGTEKVIVFEDEQGDRLQLPLDGTVHREGTLSYSGRWEGQSLVVEKTNEAGVTLTHRYNLLAGTPRRLEVYSRLAGKDGRAVTLRRVYTGVEKDE